MVHREQITTDSTFSNERQMRSTTLHIVPTSAVINSGCQIRFI